VTAHVAFLRGVNLGKRTVKSVELQAAFGKLGYAGARTLIASGNVVFDARPAKTLAAKLEAGLEAHFGFPIAVILRTQDEMRAIVASGPFAKVKLTETARPHGILFAGARPDVPLAGDAGDYDIVRADPRELYVVAWVQPRGGLGRGVTKLLAALNKQSVSTARAWNTLVKCEGSAVGAFPEACSDGPMAVR
jgi:uncharacterized protein (DUF1697 family)